MWKKVKPVLMMGKWLWWMWCALMIVLLPFAWRCVVYFYVLEVEPWLWPHQYNENEVTLIEAARDHSRVELPSDGEVTKWYPVHYPHDCRAGLQAFSTYVWAPSPQLSIHASRRGPLTLYLMTDYSDNGVVRRKTEAVVFYNIPISTEDRTTTLVRGDQ
jgi:hypothetical protein